MEIIESSKPTKPGMYRMLAEQYHADPTPEPSLSSSLVKTLHSESPLHAWYSHPRLNKHYQDSDPTAIKDFGSAVHKLVLGYGAQIKVVSGFDNWMKKEAKEIRDDARNQHLIPLLEKDYEEAEAMAGPLYEAAQDYLDIAMVDALREVVLIWKEGKFWRRAMIDAMHPNLRRICDLKTTATSCAPSVLSKFLYNQNYHVSAAFYQRGLDALDPDGMGLREFGFLFGETSAPYVNGPVMVLSEAGRMLGNKICDSSAFAWDRCLEAGVDRQHWPGYDCGPYMAEPSPWLLVNTAAEWERE